MTFVTGRDNDMLDSLLRRIETQPIKNSSRLRALKSWAAL